MKDKAQAAPRGLIILSFAAIYLIWGTTYLAIHYAVQSIPPFIMAGTRYVIAGSVLYGWARLTGTGKPDWSLWAKTAIVGALLLLGGNGPLVWSEQWVPSGLAALLIATEPLWVVVLDWLLPGGRRPNSKVIIGLVAGFAGLFLLVGSGKLSSGGHISSLGIFACLFAAFSWAAGSIYGQRAKLPSKPVLVAGMQMLTGGLMMTVAGALFGEVPRLHFGAVQAVSIIGWLYLIIFGAIVGFTAYSWLLRVCSPAQVSTSAYVNPVVAVLLGWSVAGESITLRMVAAMVIILSSVLIITQSGDRRTVEEISSSGPGDAEHVKAFEASAGIEAAD